MIAISRLTFLWFVLGLLGIGIVGGIITSYLPARLEAYASPAADGPIFAALYAGVFVAILGLAMCGSYYLHWRHAGAVTSHTHWGALRQTTLLAVGITTLLALQGFGVLSWLDGTLLIIALGLVELSFRVKQPR